MNFLTTQEVAKLLHIAESTVRLNASKDRLGFRAVRVGSQWRFRADEVYEYVYGSKWREIVKEQELPYEDTGNTESSVK